MESTTNRLKMQLKSAQSELEQTRNTLKTMEGSDGHGTLRLSPSGFKPIAQIVSTQSCIYCLAPLHSAQACEKWYLQMVLGAQRSVSTDIREADT